MGSTQIVRPGVIIEGFVTIDEERMPVAIEVGSGSSFSALEHLAATRGVIRKQLAREEEPEPIYNLSEEMKHVELRGVFTTRGRGLRPPAQHTYFRTIPEGIANITNDTERSLAILLELQGAHASK